MSLLILVTQLRTGAPTNGEPQCIAEKNESWRVSWNYRSRAKWTGGLAPVKLIDACASRNSIRFAFRSLLAQPIEPPGVANFKMDQLLLYFQTMTVTLTRTTYFHGALSAENRVLTKDSADA